jgi:hypothetical protein
MDGKLALDTIKSFKTIMPKEDYDEFLKSEDSAELRAFPEVTEFLKGEMPEQFKKKDDEGGEGKKEDEDEKGKKKEKEEGKKKEEEGEGKKKEEEEEKAVTPELIKGLKDTMDEKFAAVTSLLKDNLGIESKMTELQKSVDAVTTLVEKIAGMPLGTKAIRSGVAANFFEKAFSGDQEDDKGKRLLSVTMNKEVVLKSLEDGLNKAVDPELKKSYENSIVRYNGGGGTIDQAVAIDLFENHNVRLTQ